MSEDRSSKLFFARVAEQAERYDEMLQVMTEIANMPGELSTEERNLLSVAFKNVIGARRSSWRVLSGIRETDADENSLIVKARQMLQSNVEKELEEICKNIVNLLSTRLIPSAQSPESQVFYYKMKGDYERYLAEITTDDKRAKAAEDSLVAYKAATDIATDKLSSIDPVRLGLALNFSVFYYEILNNPERACELAENAFNLPPQDMDKLRDESHKDSALIMQLLRDNLTLWNSDVQNEDEKADTRPDGQ